MGPGSKGLMCLDSRVQNEVQTYSSTAERVPEKCVIVDSSFNITARTYTDIGGVASHTPRLCGVYHQVFSPLLTESHYYIVHGSI
jgi:hypothetical protein